MLTETQDELLLSELIDGRPVGPERLRTLLETTAGRMSLVAFATLRADLATDTSVPSHDFVARVEGRLRAPRRRALLGPLAAAAGGLLLGIVLTALFHPGSNAAPAVRASTAAESPPVATRVLRFEPGSDWTGSGS